MAVKSRRSYQGKPVSNTLGSQLLVGGTSISLSAAMSGWPTTAEPFFCVIDPGTAKEEKVCVVYATTTTLTVVDPADYTSPWGVSSNGRGVDNTTAYQHEAGAVIYPCITAREMDEANELVSTYKAQGSIVHQGASTFTELAIGTAGQVLKVNSGATAPEWGQVPTAGIADSAVTSAKIADGTIVTADLADGAVTSAKIADGTIVEADLADGAVTSAKILDGTIATGDMADSAVTTAKIADSAVTSAKIADGTIVTGDLADSAVTTAKIADSAITTGKIADGTIVNADISASAAIALSKLGTGTAAIDISGNAATATIATVATTATEAGYATTAGSATTATSATSATSASQLSASGLTLAAGTAGYSGSWRATAGISASALIATDDLFYFSNTNGGSGTALVHTGTNAIRRQSSLRRLKNSIADFGGAVDKIKKLRPRTFKWNTSSDDTPTDVYSKDVQTSHGFIVEEVMEAVEDLVYFDVAEDGTKTPVMWKQNDVIAILVKAVQELSARVEELESK